MSTLAVADTISHAAVEAVSELLRHRWTPGATYRLQFHAKFNLCDALRIVPYLHALGVSACYASPLFQASSGSTHGYDVCDPTQLNRELGTDEDLAALVEALRTRHMGLVLDVVPNHMGIGDELNLWWMDVLENGASSIYAPHFDIDWNPANPVLAQKVLLPVLGDQYGNVLEAGDIRIAYDRGAFLVRCYERRFPVAPCTYATLLAPLLPRLLERLGPEHPQVTELQSILTALSHLPARGERSPEKIAERNREKEIIKRRIAALCNSNPAIRTCLEETLVEFNGVVGQPRSFDRLDELLNHQAYRLTFWRVATEEINFRRFFDVDELAAIRTENPAVFAAAHQLAFRWIAEGKVQGLRVDHPDGLHDPVEYFHRLQTHAALARLPDALDHSVSPEDREQAVAAAIQSLAQDAVEGAIGGAVDGAVEGQARWPTYVVAEKILCQGETLPHEWAVDGTTGYDFLGLLNGLFLDPDSVRELDGAYATFLGEPVDFATLARDCKKRIMQSSLSAEINALAHQLDRISEQNRRYRDFTLNSLTLVIRETIASMQVYRAYVTGRHEPDQHDRRFVTQAVATARRRNPDTDPSIFRFLCDTLLLDNLNDFREEDRPQVLAWTMKFQQLCGPIMAKGVEDTAFYRYNRLISLNEVGGHPDVWGTSLEEFHRANLERQQHWPHSLLATSTHDTKRSEDTRARINVISELPLDWLKLVTDLAALNLSKKTTVEGNPAPDANDEYLLYQTLIGAWPDEPLDESAFLAFRERIANYMQKATREAKVHTSWLYPSEGYDTAVQQFVHHVVVPHEEDPVRQLLDPFRRRVAVFGRFNALSQTLLKLTCPGVPDIYQGSELWHLRLVDPDNRQPVDYEQRARLLQELQRRAADNLSDLAADLMANIADGRIKLYLMQRLLHYRRQRPELFATGKYVPLSATGPHAAHLCAFARVTSDATLLVIAPRWFARLLESDERLPLGAETWGETAVELPQELPCTAWEDLFSGRKMSSAGSLPAADLFRDYPFAALRSATVR